MNTKSVMIVLRNFLLCCKQRDFKITSDNSVYAVQVFLGRLRTATKTFTHICWLYRFAILYSQQTSHTRGRCAKFRFAHFAQWAALHASCAQRSFAQLPFMRRFATFLFSQSFAFVKIKTSHKRRPLYSIASKPKNLYNT